MSELDGQSQLQADTEILDWWEPGRVDLAYVPLGVPYTEQFPKRTWTIAPGLSLTPCPKKLRDLFGKGMPAEHRTFGVNYVIRLDIEAYVNSTKERLAKTLKSNDTTRIFLFPQFVATQLLLALAPNTGCRFGGYYCGKENYGGFTWTSYSHQEQQDLAPFRVEHAAGSRLNKRHVTNVFFGLDEYFSPPMRGNTILLKADRLSVACRGLWSALCTKHDEQAFITFAMILEALLTTSNLETTHQIGLGTSSHLTRKECGTPANDLQTG